MFYFYDIQHFKIDTGIKTDNTLPNHVRFSGISYNFWNTYNVYLYRDNVKKT